MASPNKAPLKQFVTLLDNADFAFVVYYRGHWCPFCQAYLKEFHSIESSIVAAGGVPIIVTSEVPEHLETMRTTTGYSGEAIVDTENLLPTEMKRRGFVDVAISEKSGYDHGMAQPAVLVIKRDRTVLFSWAIVPATMNLGGAKDRPLLTQIWENVQAQLEGKPPVHKTYRKLSFLQGIGQKIFG